MDKKVGIIKKSIVWLFLVILILPVGIIGMLKSWILFVLTGRGYVKDGKKQLKTLDEIATGIWNGKKHEG